MKKCPFCLQEIQENALKCHYCGKPLSGSDASDVRESCTECGTPVPIDRGFCPRCGVIQVRRAQGREVTKCPACRSSQIERISAARKAGYVALLGIFAPAFKSVRSQFKCKSCNHKW
jgi:hypothetical protein